jgi:hypothetical protein
MMIGSPGGPPGGLGNGSGKASIRARRGRTEGRFDAVIECIGSFSRHGVAGQTPVLAAGRVTSPMAAISGAQYARVDGTGTGPLHRLAPLQRLPGRELSPKPEDSPEIGFADFAGAAQLRR